jgi:phosphate transport system substrate-binding protein
MQMDKVIEIGMCPRVGVGRDVIRGIGGVRTMRKLLVCMIVGVALAGIGTDAAQSNEKGSKTVRGIEMKGTLTLSGAWALYPMVVKWAEEFQKIYPDVKIDVSAGGAGKGMADCLARVVDLGMVSREIYPEEVEKGAWWVSVTKDAVVATINEENPVLDDILAHGISRDEFVGLWIDGTIQNWSDLADRSVPYTINVYTRSDACGASETWAAYLGKKQEDLLGVGVYGDPGLAEAVRQDELGIGYNNVNYAYDGETKQHVKGIMVVPIDLNGDGVVDSTESFYENRDGLVHAIAGGVYPSPPARDLHLVSNGVPESPVVREFIRWVLTEGQQYVPEAGYINLTEERLREELESLDR